MSGASLSVIMAQQIFTHRLLALVAISILIYDYLLTCGNEIDYLWRRPKTRSTYLFFVNRYFVLPSQIYRTAFLLSEIPPDRCLQYNIANSLLAYVSQLIVGGLLGLRLYVLYNRPSWVLWFMAGGVMVAFGTIFWGMFAHRFSPEKVGCHPAISLTITLNDVAPWEVLFVYDSIVFGFVVRHAWIRWHENQLVISRRVFPIYYTMIRDGVLYFAVVMLVNLANILTYYLGGPFMRGGLASVANTVSSTMMSRIMLNLHETTDTGIYSTSETSQFIAGSISDTTRVRL